MSSFLTPHYIGYELTHTISEPFGPEFPERPSLFVDREEELAFILTYLDQVARPPGVLLFGQGGIGKTTTAIEAAYRSWERRDFEEVLFLTAKIAYWNLEDRHEIIVDRRRGQSRFATFKGLLDRLNMNIDRPYYRSSNRNDEEARRKHLYSKLEGRRVLFVIDNLDSINRPTYEELRKFVDLVNFLPPGNKAIITSRQGGALKGHGLIELELASLDLQASYALISSLATDVHLPTYQYRELLENTVGNPLVIEQLAVLLKRTDSRRVSQVLDTAKRKGMLSYLFQAALSQISQNGRKVLYAIVLATYPVTSRFLTNVLNLPPEEVETALKELGEWSLLTRRGQRYDVHYLLEEYISELMRNSPKPWERLSRDIQSKETTLDDRYF